MSHGQSRAVHPELTTEEYLNHLEWAERDGTKELKPEEYDDLARTLAKMAYDWTAEPDSCADWWASNDIEVILANAAVCVLRAKDAAYPEEAS